MANYPPPTEDLPIFDPTVFDRNDIPLTIAEGLNYFLAFPIAQGPEEIGDLTVGNSGICPTMPLVPPDNSLHMANTTWVQQYITGSLTGFAPINSPAFTGIPTVPTPAPSDNSQQIPNTSWVRTYASSTYQTLSGMSLYALLASPIFSGTPTTPSPVPLDNSLQIPNTSWVQQYITGSLTGFAPINSPVFTGDPQVPLPAPSNNSATIPSTSWVRTYASSTYQTIADMSLYLTIASASATYLTIANAASTYLTIANAASTYLTIANAASTYLTIANAAATYQTIAGMSSYLTISVAAATYQTLAGMVNYALLASPTFTGIPAAPLPTPANNNTSQIATCAWVNTAIGASGGGDAFLAGGTFASPQTFTGYDAFSNNITTGGVPVGRGATNQLSNSVLGLSALNTTTTNVYNSVAVGYQALPNEVGTAPIPIYTIASINLNSGGTVVATPANTTNTGALIFSGGSPTVAATGTYQILLLSVANTVIAVNLTSGGSGYLTTPIISCDFSTIQPPGCIDILNPSFIAPVITPFMSQTGTIAGLGNGNTAIGTTALQNQNGASFNTALGYGAGANITTGSNNTCIGVSSAVLNPSGSNQIALGTITETTTVAGLMNFTNYTPQTTIVPNVPASITNKAYVDSVIPSLSGYALLNGNQTFTGLNQFTQLPTSIVAATTAYQFMNRQTSGQFCDKTVEGLYFLDPTLRVNGWAIELGYVDRYGYVYNSNTGVQIPNFKIGQASFQYQVFTANTSAGYYEPTPSTMTYNMGAINTPTTFPGYAFGGNYGFYETWNSPFAIPTAVLERQFTASGVGYMYPFNFTSTAVGAGLQNPCKTLSMSFTAYSQSGNTLSSSLQPLCLIESPVWVDGNTLSTYPRLTIYITLSNNLITPSTCYINIMPLGFAAAAHFSS